jgi:hypothetical protein
MVYLFEGSLFSIYPDRLLSFNVDIAGLFLADWLVGIVFPEIPEMLRSSLQHWLMAQLCEYVSQQIEPQCLALASYPRLSNTRGATIRCALTGPWRMSNLPVQGWDKGYLRINPRMRLVRAGTRLRLIHGG